MTENERKIKRRVQLVVAASMAVFFCLLLTLAVQLSIRANQKAMIRSLNKAQAALYLQLQDEKDRIDFFKSSRFIDEHAMREGFGRYGSNIFK